MIHVTHSCGDCGFLADDYVEFGRHHTREWHRLVMLVGLRAALDYSVSSILPDAERAVTMFRPPTDGADR